MDKTLYSLFSLYGFVREKQYSLESDMFRQIDNNKWNEYAHTMLLISSGSYH